MILLGGAAMKRFTVMLVFLSLHSGVQAQQEMEETFTYGVPPATCDYACQVAYQAFMEDATSRSRGSGSYFSNTRYEMGGGGSIKFCEFTKAGTGSLTNYESALISAGVRSPMLLCGRSVLYDRR